MRIRGRHRRIAKGDDESGAALIEFAIGATLLLALLFGIVEFGLAFRDRLTITNSTQAAARVGSALGNDDQTDFEILKSLEQSLGTLPNSGIGIIRFVDVYQADANGQPLNTCNGGGSNKCNRYLYHPGFTPTCDWNPCPDADDGYTGWGWAPSARDVALPGLDVLGVRLTFAHEWVTGGLVPLPNVDCDGTPGAGCWADTAIMRIEPQVFEP